MKRTGNLYEQIFFAEALSKDLEVFTPLGDYLPQDCLMMNKAGKVFKTQIKGTADKVRDSRGGLGRYMITCALRYVQENTYGLYKDRRSCRIRAPLYPPVLNTMPSY